MMIFLFISFFSFDKKDPMCLGGGRWSVPLNQFHSNISKYFLLNGTCCSLFRNDSTTKSLGAGGGRVTQVNVTLAAGASEAAAAAVCIIRYTVSAT
jgi:hypothetical protein